MYDLLFPRLADLIGDLDQRDTYKVSYKPKYLNHQKPSIEYPRLNIYNDGDFAVIDATVPGLSKDDISLSWYDGYLSISAESQNIGEKKFSLREIHLSSFNRSIKVDKDTLDIDRMTATVVNGILSIKIPRIKQKFHENNVKKINIY